MPLDAAEGVAVSKYADSEMAVTGAPNIVLTTPLVVTRKTCLVVGVPDMTVAK